MPDLASTSAACRRLKRASSWSVFFLWMRASWSCLLSFSWRVRSSFTCMSRSAWDSLSSAFSFLRDWSCARNSWISTSRSLRPSSRLSRARSSASRRRRAARSSELTSDSCVSSDDLLSTASCSCSDSSRACSSARARYSSKPARPRASAAVDLRNSVSSCTRRRFAFSSSIRSCMSVSRRVCMVMSSSSRIFWDCSRPERALDSATSLRLSMRSSPSGSGAMTICGNRCGSSSQSESGADARPC
mmetsp:Transcript_6531/g.19070  ORF Transcript_6531/g.19070 Transcript_6531/m.19070 type:complete len:245 (-) Transcript_6531:7-741(-)